CAAFEPIITAGVGGVLAGHSTSTQGDVQFMVSGAAGRLAYYVGAFFLFWVPLLHLTRGGMAWITGMIYQPRTESEFWLMIATLAFTAVLAFILLIICSRLLARVVSRISYRKISFAVLIVLLLIVYGFTGLRGLVIMAISTGLGLIPPMFRTRRLNLILGFFFPIFLNMAGMRGDVLQFLGVY
ncbi:MAG: tripartite tricarboxylate transporter permease, partial [Candidatus Hadarchaeales archaeon]